MNAELWEQMGRYLHLLGKEIFCVDSCGRGEPLLCLHGFPTSSYDYHKIWEALSERFRTVAFDMVGYGFSSKPRDFDYKTFSQVNILEKLLAELGLRRIHILSHDYGNTIVQELLARENEGKLEFEIASICFMNGALFPESHRPILAQKLLIGPIGPIFGRLIPESQFKQSLASVFGPKTRPTDREMDEFIEIFQRNGGRRISHKLIQYMKEREIYRSRWLGALQNMSQPFRFINGLEDPVSGGHLVRRFRELLPEQIDLVEIQDIGHYPHFESPQTVIRLYFEFHEKILQKS